MTLAAARSHCRHRFFVALLLLFGAGCGRTDRPEAAATGKPLRIRTAALSPDGSRIAFTTDTAWSGFSELWVGDAKPGAEPTRIGPGMGAYWSPDGTRLAHYRVVDRRLQIFLWDVASGRASQLTRFPDGVLPSPYGNVDPGDEGYRISWSPDGTRIVFASRVREPAEPVGDSLPIVITERSPSPRVWAGLIKATFGGTQYVDGAFEVTMLEADEALRVGNEVVQLFVVTVATGAARQLTTDRAGSFDPAWSPDGGTIGYESAEGAPMLASRLRGTNLWRIDSSGANPTALTRTDGRKYGPRWTTDGRSIVVSYRPDGSYHERERWLIRVADGTIERDSARVADAVAALPPATRPGVLRLTPIVRQTKLEVALPGAAPFVVADYTRPPSVEHRERGTPFTWTGARGRTMEGRLLLPKDYQPGRRYPLIVDPYQEWQWPDTLTNAGYVLFAPNTVRAPHSPAGFDDRGDFYRKLVVDSPAVAVRITVDDVLTGVDSLIRSGLVDSSRMALVGFSNGGGVVNYLVTETNRFRCGVAQSPAAGEMTSIFFVDPDGEYLLTFLSGKAPWDDPAMYAAISPVYRVNRITVPMLYAIGDLEGLVFQTQALYMYTGLRRLQRPVTLVRYPGQSHGLNGWAALDLAVRARRFVDGCTR